MELVRLSWNLLIMSWPPLQERLLGLLEPGYLLYAAASGGYRGFLVISSLTTEFCGRILTMLYSFHRHRLRILCRRSQLPFYCKHQESP